MITDNELKRITDLIWSTLNAREHENKTKDQQRALIEPIIEQLAKEQRLIGRKQIIRHIQVELNDLDHDI
jgi:hypothetical protein